jgi:predicted metal-dependent hydrolase
MRQKTKASVQELRYGRSTIKYALSYKQRKTLAIEVHPDCRVEVIAPLGASLEKIQAKVKKRAAWILKQQRQFESYPMPLPKREFVSGESYRYLGKQYRLKVTQAKENSVRLYRGRLEVSAKRSTPAIVSKLLKDWFRNKAEIIFQERYEVCKLKAQKHRIQHGQGFELRLMPKRWGSCTKQGKLLLNPALVAASKEAIDYVILHELCHTLEHNHSRRFYKLLHSLLPDWEECRSTLNRYTEILEL